MDRTCRFNAWHLADFFENPLDVLGTRAFIAVLGRGCEQL
jgi:hypothetical protein